MTNMKPKSHMGLQKHCFNIKDQNYYTAPSNTYTKQTNKQNQTGCQIANNHSVTIFSSLPTILLFFLLTSILVGSQIDPSRLCIFFKERLGNFGPLHTRCLLCENCRQLCSFCWNRDLKIWIPNCKTSYELDLMVLAECPS